MNNGFGGSGVGTNNDLPIIEEIGGTHSRIQEILVKRKNCLKALTVPWSQGKISDTIRQLVKYKDKGVSCDFFNAAFMCNSYNKDYLKLDDSIAILPLVEVLVSSKYETNFRCGIKMVCMLFDMYSDMIRQSMRTMKGDPKTIDNYKKLIDFFDNIPNIETIKKRDLKADKNLNALLQEMKEFCESCKK